ncbi:MAG: phosphoglucosamine mutase, partial [Synergistales bacterium]|nr:phosphoglucosamine mutase [Synergistales bacterium]
MTPEMALRLGRSYVLFLTEQGIPRPTLVIGRDTRRSGQMLESAIISGLTSAGAQVKSLGISPTPEVSFAIKYLHAHGGVVISASHNPAEYNGIKFLDKEGKKLSDENEASIEDYLGDNFLDDWRPTGASIGTFYEEKNVRHAYCEWLTSILSGISMEGYKCIVDCANGAATPVIKKLLQDAGLSWTLVGAEPDGLNINDGVGVMAMKHLSQLILKRGCDMGIAYDGDADRVLVTDPLGRIIDGDIIL